MPLAPVACLAFLRGVDPKHADPLQCDADGDWCRSYKTLKLDRAEVDLAAYDRHDVEIRGRQERLAVRAIKRATELTAMS